MQLENGVRFRMAPRFARRLAWNQRLQLSAIKPLSAHHDLHGDRWLQAGEQDCSLLVATESSDDAWHHDLCLFAIPEHLRARWWELAARQAETLPAPLEGMESFAREIAEFAHFKRVPLPRQCTFDVTLSAAETPAGRPLPPSWEAEAVAGNAPVVARVNLGDERRALIFLNLGRSRLAELLDGPGQGRKAATAPRDDLVRAFGAQFPDYPLVRLVLDPGEGIWFPSSDVIYAADRCDKADLDVWLILKDEGGKIKEK